LKTQFNFKIHMELVIDYYTILFKIILFLIITSKSSLFVIIFTCKDIINSEMPINNYIGSEGFHIELNNQLLYPFYYLES